MRPSPANSIRADIGSGYRPDIRLQPDPDRQTNFASAKPGGVYISAPQGRRREIGEAPIGEPFRSGLRRLHEACGYTAAPRGFLPASPPVEHYENFLSPHCCCRPPARAGGGDGVFARGLTTSPTKATRRPSFGWRGSTTTSAALAARHRTGQTSDDPTLAPIFDRPGATSANSSCRCRPLPRSSTPQSGRRQNRYADSLQSCPTTAAVWPTRSGCPMCSTAPPRRTTC